MAEANEVPHGFLKGQVCTLKEDVTAQHWNQRKPGLPEFTDLHWPAGTRVKVVSVSRFWDCGITTDLTAENGYDARVSPGILETDNESSDILKLRLWLHKMFLEQQAAFKRPLR